MATCKTCKFWGAEDIDVSSAVSAEKGSFRWCLLTERTGRGFPAGDFWDVGLASWGVAIYNGEGRVSSQAYSCGNHSSALTLANSLNS